MATDNPFEDPSLKDPEVQPQTFDVPGYEAPLSWEQDEEAGQFEGGSSLSDDAASQWRPAAESGVYEPPPQPSRGGSQQEDQGMSSDAMLMYMRLINVGAAVLVSTAAVLNLVSLPEFDVGIICIYLWFFALVLCCFETHFKAVSKIIGQNFGFLYHAKGRLVFMVLVATLCFSLGLLGLIAGCAVFAAAAFNTYVICKHPEYEAATQKLDLEQQGPGSFGEARQGVYAPPAEQANRAGAPGAGAAGASLAGAVAGWAVQNPAQAQAGLSGLAGWASENPQAARTAANAAGSGYEGF